LDDLRKEIKICGGQVQSAPELFKGWVRKADKSNMRARIVMTPFSLIMLGLVAVGSSDVARAQIDPSSALLLNQGDRRVTTDPAVDSGRYKVVPRANPTARKSQAVESGGQESAEPAPPAAATPVPQPVVSEAISTQNASGDSGSVGSQGLESGGQRRLRDGLLEIRVAPAFIYNDSDSAYYYRRYHSASAAISADANVWFSPSTGMALGYLGTLGGHVGDSLNGSKNVAAHQEWFSVGIRTKKLPVTEQESPLHSFGFDYVDYQFRIPGTSTSRQKLATTGVRLSMETEVPVNPLRSWVFGLSFSPKLQHRELRSSGFFRSGPGAEASALGVSLGGKIKLDSDNAAYWQISHSFEKDLFSGTATSADPISGLTPSGVSVMNSFTIFRFGYSWGD
jgi:hypothetical protein